MNWLLYIHTVEVGRVLELSLGYYINPLVNVLFGRVFLGERLSRTQMAAAAIAGAGVLNLVIAYGEVPWLALGLAVTFAIYGLLRKIVPVDALPGLFIETVMLFPFAAVGLFLFGHSFTLGRSAQRHPAADGGARHLPAAALVHLCGAAIEVERYRLLPVHLAQHPVPAGGLRLRRAFRAGPLRDLRPDLDRHRHLHPRAAADARASGHVSAGDQTRARTGVLYALAAFLCWGFNPFYFKSIADVPAPEVLGHRIVWSMAILLPMVAGSPAHGRRW